MAVSVMEGEDYKIMISNETTAKTWGGTPGRIGLPLKQAYPGIEETKTYENLEKVMSQKGFNFVGNVFDYMYEKKYYFDTNYHLVSEAREFRTKKLIEDLKEHIK
jgi:hypothetical protein